MGKSSKGSAGFAIIEVLAAFLLLVVLAFVIHFVTHSNSHKTSPTKSTPTTAGHPTNNVPNQYAILPPATVPPKTPECSQQITFSDNGDSGPVTCANGDLNVLEWKALATLEPSVFNLGYNATAAPVQSALCADVSANVSNPIAETNYQIASLYYGWSFSADPGVVLTNGTCVNEDD